MQLSINRFKVCQCHLLFQNHLVETDNEICIEETTVEYSKTETATDELEVVQMLRVDTRSGINLKGVVIVGGVFE